MDPPAVTAMHLFGHHSGLLPSVPGRPELIGPGAALAGYGWLLRDDLGWAAYGVICFGIFVATVGETVYSWAGRGLELWSDWLEAEPQCLAPELALARAWRRFWWSLAAMFALGGFSLWRVEVTVWRPVGERFYFFRAGTWLGRLEHSWLNDALYAFGMAGILYVLYTLKEFAGSWFGGPADALLRGEDNEPTEDRWTEHQQRSKLMIGTGIVIILIWAWLEEVADLVPGYVFDKWDIVAIYFGFIAGYSVMQRLPYPVFGIRPPFCLGPAGRGRWIEDARRLFYVAFVWAYTSLTEPTVYGDRFSHLAELSVIVLGSMWLLDVSRQPERPLAVMCLGNSDSQSGL